MLFFKTFVNDVSYVVIDKKKCLKTYLDRDLFDIFIMCKKMF